MSKPTTLSGAPACGPTTLELVLYPRSARALLAVIDAGLETVVVSEEPSYVIIDIENLRNHLRAHLQRVAIGE